MALFDRPREFVDRIGAGCTAFTVSIDTQSGDRIQLHTAADKVSVDPVGNVLRIEASINTAYVVGVLDRIRMARKPVRVDAGPLFLSECAALQMMRVEGDRQRDGAIVTLEFKDILRVQRMTDAQIASKRLALASPRASMDRAEADTATMLRDMALGIPGVTEARVEFHGEVFHLIFGSTADVGPDHVRKAMDRIRPAGIPLEVRRTGLGPVGDTRAVVRAADHLEPPPQAPACSVCGSDLLFSARQRGGGMCGPCSRDVADPASPGTAAHLELVARFVPGVTSAIAETIRPGFVRLTFEGDAWSHVVRAAVEPHLTAGVQHEVSHGIVVDRIACEGQDRLPPIAAAMPVARTPARTPTALDPGKMTLSFRGVEITGVSVGDMIAVPPKRDPLDAVIDGVTLRVLLEIDEDFRRETTPRRHALVVCTPAQVAAVAAHWSAQLRARVEEGRARDAARAPSVCVQIDAEDL